MKYPLLLRTGAGMPWVALLVWALSSCNPPVEVPTDPSTFCSVSASTIATFFKSGTVTENGIVNPANSLNFVNAPNCGFYRWAEQMFLWVTSPAPSEYGGGGRVFDSSVFFDLSPPDASGNQTLIPHSAGLFHVMAVRAAQVGPHRLPVILNKAGKLIEIAPTPVAPDGRQLILNRAGQQVEVEEIRTGENGRPVFLGKDHQPIDGAHPLFTNLRPSKTIVERFMVGRSPVFLDQAADIVEVQLGEADNSVLITQGNSLVYYIVMVNDVFAYFRTGTADGQISAFHFPNSQSDLSAITNFARTTKHVTFPDSVAMAVELKTAWVLASTVPDPSTYITVMAEVPHYNKTATQWTLVPNVMDTVKLALVGLHFVGSANGRPEMIWSTFVHDSVAPDTSYQYRNTSFTNSTTVTANTNGSWLLCANGSLGPYNTMRQQIDPSTGNINATMGNTIGPSDIIAMKPWGAGFADEPNPIDDDAPMSNAEIISINDNVRGTLIAGDPRKNYIFRGAMWTSDGGAPGNIGPIGNQFGTTALANVTMETFQQGRTTSTFTGLNCFGCHNAANPGPVCDTGISHIWPFVKKLY